MGAGSPDGSMIWMSALSVTAMMILVESPAYLLDSGFSSWSFGCFWEWGSLRKDSVPLQEREKKMDKGT